MKTASLAPSPKKRDVFDFFPASSEPSIFGLERPALGNLWATASPARAGPGDRGATTSPPPRSTRTTTIFGPLTGSTLSARPMNADTRRSTPEAGDAAGGFRWLTSLKS